MKTVNRYLKDKAMDHIDHALGRPVDPQNNAHSHRNYFAVSCNAEKAKFRASPHWIEGRTFERMTWFHVSEEGRAALAAHLKEIGDPYRLFQVHYDHPAYETWSVLVAAKSRAAARYSYFLDVTDTRPDLTFGEFCKHTSARLARV